MAGTLQITRELRCCASSPSGSPARSDLAERRIQGAGIHILELQDAEALEILAHMRGQETEPPRVRNTAGNTPPLNREVAMDLGSISARLLAQCACWMPRGVRGLIETATLL